MKAGYQISDSQAQNMKWFWPGNLVKNRGMGHNQIRQLTIKMPLEKPKTHHSLASIKDIMTNI